MMKIRPRSKRATGSVGSSARRESRNHSTSMGAPSSMTRRPALSRTTECRPSAPTTRSARISSGPRGVLTVTPTTRPESSIRPVTSASIRRRNAAYRAPWAARKFKKSHCGMEDEEPAARRQMGEVGDRHAQLAELRPELADLLMRQLQQLVQHAQLVHQLERGGVDGVAPK